MTTKAFSKLQSYLSEMFQFGDNDLDFGIYKLLRLKRSEIRAFIEGTESDALGPSIRRTLAELRRQREGYQGEQLKKFVREQGGKRYAQMLLDLQDSRSEGTEAELAALIEQGAEDAAEKQQLLATLRAAAGGTSTGEMEDRVYNHLLAFFRLYYNNGDFGYNDRALAPFRVEYDEEYDGSDVLFHWKHRGSYYIKTGNGFDNVRFDAVLDGEKRSIEYRLEGGGDGTATVAQNSNKDEQRKHYRLHRIEQRDGTWTVLFRLAAASTPKPDVYRTILSEVFGHEEDLTPYLFRKDDKPVFTDLEGEYDKVSDGQVKASSGRGALHLSWEKYREHLAARNEFTSRGKNAGESANPLEKDATAKLLHTLDRNLNRFYIGSDADYFIHKDLRGFLGREKAKYVKNVILGDLDGLLAAERDSTALVVARAFNTVAERIIEFLDATETFQRNLFLLRKKVVSTDWLISTGKVAERVDAGRLDEGVWKRLLDNPPQRAEWKEMYRVDVDDLFGLRERPTLVVDTRHYRDTDPALVDELIGSFDNLDEQTDGLLINSENFQALQLLQDKYRGRVNCIYIDPPYNTGGDGFLYKDRFRHSSWLSMMENRLNAASPFISDDGFLFVSIGDHEEKHLAQLLQYSFGAENEVAKYTWKSRTKPVNAGGAKYRPQKGAEYVFSYSPGGSQTAHYSLGSEAERTYPHQDKHGKYRITSILTSNRGRYQRETMRFAINGYAPPRDKRWKGGKEEIGALFDSDRIDFNDEGEPFLKVYEHEEEQQHQPLWTFMEKQLSGTAEKGKALLNDVIGIWHGLDSVKPTELIQYLTQVTTGENAVVLDFFAGSGTTGHAILHLNKTKDAHRQCVLVEMGEYFDTVLKPRIQKVMYTANWKDGQPRGEVDGYAGLIKYQRLEQYEDVLNALRPDDGTKLPDDAPLRYLFRPQEQQVRSTLDLRRPFGNVICYGKENTCGKADLLETYLYLRDRSVYSQRRYEIGGKTYRVAHTPYRLVIFRDIRPDENDSAALREIVAKYDKIESVDLNAHAPPDALPELRLHTVTAADFDVGAQWS